MINTNLMIASEFASINIYCLSTNDLFYLLDALKNLYLAANSNDTANVQSPTGLFIAFHSSVDPFEKPEPSKSSNPSESER